MKNKLDARILELALIGAHQEVIWKTMKLREKSMYDQDLDASIQDSYKMIQKLEDMLMEL